MRFRFALSAVSLAAPIGLAVAGGLAPGLATPAFAQALVSDTPTSYGVTLRRVEFQNSAGVWVPFFEGSTLIDVAAVNAGAQAGSVGTGNSLPPGTYTALRVTVERSFALTGTTPNAGAAGPLGPQPCSTGGPNGTNTGVAGTNPVSQTVPIPDNAFPPEGWEEVTDQTMRAGDAVSFTVPEGGAFEPSFSIGFSVTDAISFITTGAGTCQVFPGDVEVTVE